VITRHEGRQTLIIRVANARHNTILRAFLVLNVGGVDDSSFQQLHARHVYSWRDIRWQHRYEDITSVSPQGRLLLDYTKFHDTVPE
jgi:inward rectifier potassium channel